MRDTGSCLCGKQGLCYSITRDKVLSAHHCHCRDCQRVTGCGKATILIVPSEDFEYQGEAARHMVIGTDGGHVWREFCPTCGSQIFSYMEETPHFWTTAAGWKSAPTSGPAPPNRGRRWTSHCPVWKRTPDSEYSLCLTRCIALFTGLPTGCTWGGPFFVAPTARVSG